MSKADDSSGFVSISTVDGQPTRVVGARDRPRDAHDQPLPARNTTTPIIHLVLRDVSDELVRADLLARAELGKRRYGAYLQAHNGRDAARDSYEEALDLVMYLRQLAEETEDERDNLHIGSELYPSALWMACQLRRFIDERGGR